MAALHPFLQERPRIFGSRSCASSSHLSCRVGNKEVLTEKEKLLATKALIHIHVLCVVMHIACRPCKRWSWTRETTFRNMKLSVRVFKSKIWQQVIKCCQATRCVTRVKCCRASRQRSERPRTNYTHIFKDHACIERAHLVQAIPPFLSVSATILRYAAKD